jgi:sensor histidine kinase YesM
MGGLKRELVRSYLVFCCNRGPILVDLLYTVIIWAGIAGFLMVTGLRRPHVGTFIVCESIGVSLFTARRILFLLFEPRRTLSLIFTLMAALAIGLPTGYQLAGFVFRLVFSVPLKANPPQMIVFFIVYGTAITFVFYSKYRLEASRELAQQERIKRLSVEKEAIESNLRLLQAQIEPHFLFNTLSNILSLIDTDPAKGKSMLANLIYYLRTSLSRTLPAVTTLGQEIETIRAYLDIQKIRMSERLRFAIDIPEELLHYPLPPMLLQPLVENAVKHGVEPRIEGGEITIRTSVQDEAVRVEISDTGNGFSSCHEPGIGIGNVRERIKLLYGEKGRLILQENDPRGVTAIVEVPGHGV